MFAQEFKRRVHDGLPRPDACPSAHADAADDFGIALRYASNKLFTRLAKAGIVESTAVWSTLKV